MNENLAVYLSQDRLAALAQGRDLPERQRGAALLADISGFTPLTEQLTQRFGERRGIEELTRRINAVYDALIGDIERYGGSVVGFAGDAMTCWFDEAPELPSFGKLGNSATASTRAVAAAFAVQTAMRRFPELGIKVAVASGPVRRFVVGDPAIQQLDTLAGATLTRLATAEHLAGKGDVVVDAETAFVLRDLVEVREWPVDYGTNLHFAKVGWLRDEVIPAPLPSPVRALAPEELRPWVLGTVFTREQSGLGAFLTELRPATALFMSFGGLDYDVDEQAGEKLDAVTRRVQGYSHPLRRRAAELTIGDKGNYFYANFGAVVSHEDDARRAIQAALESANSGAGVRLSCSD